MRIEYEDRDILVIYKEAGLPVQTARTSRRDLVSLLKNHLARTNVSEEEKAETQKAGNPKKGSEKGSEKRSEKGSEKGLQKSLGGRAQEPYLGIIHRLDQPVEGLLVFAKTPKSAAALSAQAAAKSEMEKTYQAIVCLDGVSYPLAVEGMKREVALVDWLGRDGASNTAYVASEGEKGAKRAELVFRTLWIRKAKALLEIRLRTGRHHQIRIQMAHAGMPLLGDRKYGTQQQADSGEWQQGDMSREQRGMSREQRGMSRQQRGMSREQGGMSRQQRGMSRQQGDMIWGSKDESESYPLCLCACGLTFRHSATKKKMTFSVTPSWLPVVEKNDTMKTVHHSEQESGVKSSCSKSGK